MNQNLTVLVVGSGAREHALCWALEHSPRVARVICTPGNGGIAVENRRDVKESDIAGIVQLARDEAAGLVVIGPEAPLVLGLVDELTKAGIKAFGPSAKAAQLEGSKIYAKTLCSSEGIPTAQWRWADTYDAAKILIESWGSVPVIKADGLCGGKGVVVASTVREALDAARDMLVKKTLGDAGSRIIIEDRLVGRECSVMALCDGEHSVLLPPARDYKRAYDGEKGPNTGGMGAYSPVFDLNDALLADIKKRIIDRTLYCMAKHEGTPFQGVLYAGIMVTQNGPELLEYNVRFGDPEAQVVLARVSHSELVEHMLACTERGGLSRVGPLTVLPSPAVCVTLASAGYPATYKTGVPITGIEGLRGCALFHAGTKRTNEGLVTSGGRVMSVVALGDSIEDARTYANSAADKVMFANKYRRTDIAQGVA